MLTYERFYDHFVIKEDNKILYHVDTEAEAKQNIFLLSSENIDNENINIKNTKNYTVYHLHTEDSLLDSCTNYKLYVDRAVELGQKAIGFSCSFSFLLVVLLFFLLPFLLELTSFFIGFLLIVFFDELDLFVFLFAIVYLIINYNNIINTI